MTVARLGAFELIVALTAIQRLAELVHSRRNLARLAPGSTNADSRANFSMLVVLQTLWLAGSAFEPARRGDTAAWTWFVLGLVLFALGQALRVWCIVTLGRWWNARARIDPALEVVTSGPYRCATPELPRRAPRGRGLAAGGRRSLDARAPGTGARTRALAAHPRRGRAALFGAGLSRGDGYEGRAPSALRTTMTSLFDVAVVGG